MAGGRAAGLTKVRTSGGSRKWRQEGVAIASGRVGGDGQFGAQPKGAMARAGRPHGVVRVVAALTRGRACAHRGGGWWRRGGVVVAAAAWWRH